LQARRFQVERVVRLDHVVVVDLVDRRQVFFGRCPDVHACVNHAAQSISRQLGTMDRIELRGMSFHGRHGVRDAERDQTQEFKVDIEIDADLAEPGRTDRLADTIDYTQVRAAARDVIEGESKKLLESLPAATRRAPACWSACATASSEPCRRCAKSSSRRTRRIRSRRRPSMPSTASHAPSPRFTACPKSKFTCTSSAARTPWSASWALSG